MTSFRAALFALVLLASRGLVAQAPKTDVIRGRVVGPDTMPIANAQVVAVDTAAKVPHPTRTDAKGAFSITIENGRGVYMVAVNMLGYAAQRRTVSRGADGTVPPVEFKLSQVAAQLGAQRIVGERPKVSRSDIAGDNSVGGSTAFIDASSGRLGDFTGDLTLALASIPGVTVIPSADGGLPQVSAFGIGGDQNGLILNGMGFGGSTPRDGMRVQVVTASYDPSKGGFAGIQTSVRLSAGGNMIQRSLHGTLDAPSLQWTTPVARRLSTRYDQQILSGALSGPIVLDHVFYSTSFQFQRRASGLTSLTSADAAALSALRLSPDSVTRLFAALGPTGIPLTTSAIPNGRENREARVAARIDWVPHPALSPGFTMFGANATQDAYYLQAGGTVRNNDGVMVGATSIPSFGGEQTHRDGWLQFTAAKYLPKSILNETTVSLSGSVDKTDPYLELPAARILVASTLPGGESGLTMLSVGGNSAPRSDSRNWQTEIRNQSSWNTWDRRHSIQLTLTGARDGYSIRQDAGFGSFTYNSLADFTNGSPAAYSRTLTGRQSSGYGYSGAIGLGDTWLTRSPNAPVGPLPVPSAPPTTIQYGLRLEGNKLGTRPSYNRLVDSVFGLRTDHVPGSIALTPMIGFRTYFGGPIPPSSSGIIFFGAPRGTLSGGVRQYRGSIAARTLESYIRQTGLPDAIRQLYCVGSATPSANWNAFNSSSSNVPTTCADGSAATPLAQNTPPVALYGPDWELFESWRPQLNMSWQLRPELSFNGGATYTLNRNAPSVYDVNFRNQPRFTLASEGGRPVYVSASSIIPSTGAEAWTESRVSNLFAHVAESRADLHSDTKTLSGGLSWFQFNTTPFANSWNVSTSYTFSDSREQYRGFLQTTSGDPTTIGWSRGTQARHAITMTVGHRRANFAFFSLFGRIQSGQFYTPLVIGDVNGDGYSNDRAFIFNPATTTDTAIANPISRLIAGGTAGARKCLQRQLGTIAGRNSCTGPWSFSNLSLQIQPDAYRVGLGNRGQVSLFVNNILSGLDQALHGADKLHGWGQQSFVDQTLMTVRGYDPAKQRFIYAVNPQFGSTTVFRNTFRAPFQLTVDFRMEVGPDRESQILADLLTPRKADGVARFSEQQIRAKIMRGFNPVDQLLMVKDSLKLTPAQVDSMTKIGQRNLAVRDSIAGRVAKYLFERNGDFSGAEVRAVWHNAGIATYTSYFKTMRSIIDLFTPEQIERAKTVPQTAGLVTQIKALSEADLPMLFRTPLGQLP